VHKLAEFGCVELGEVTHVLVMSNGASQTFKLPEMGEDLPGGLASIDSTSTASVTSESK